MPKLNSVLKNVPIDLRNELVKYHTKNSRHRLRWKGREPKPGKKYSKWGGSLSLENAKSADLYVDNIESKKERGNMWLENYELKKKIRLIREKNEHLSIENHELKQYLPIVDGVKCLVEMLTLKNMKFLNLNKFK